MIGGIDKYYQIVKCFRDEDLRADRQPEFTQIDCEMSFVNQEDIFKQFEGLMSRLFSKFLNQENVKFERMTYNDAIENYGIDKPDLRYDLRINDIKELIKHLTDRNIGVLITDHQSREVLDTCEYSYIMHAGEIISEGTSDHIISDQDARKFYLGQSFRV